MLSTVLVACGSSSSSSTSAQGTSTTGAGQPAPAPPGQPPQLVDFHWVRPFPANIVEVRAIRQALRVPALLYEACNPRRQRDPPKHWGENSLYHMLAEVELLNLVNTQSGVVAIRQAFARGIYEATIYQNCLVRMVPLWNHRDVGAPPSASTMPGWIAVQRDLRGIDEGVGTPGSDGIPGCRGDEEGNYDPTMALVLRTWLLGRASLERVLSAADFHSLETHVSRVAWIAGGVAPADEKPPCAIPVPETENHQLLIETSRFLHNEWLPYPQFNQPNGTLRDYLTDPNTDNNSNGVGDRLRRWIQLWQKGDFLEYNARPYARWQMLGLLNLYDFSKDIRLRFAAGTVLDLLSAKAATESMNQLRTPPYRRKQSNNNNLLFEGDDASPLYQVWTGDLAPISLPNAWSAQEMTLAASSYYRPPDILTDIMVNPKRSSYMQQFDGRGQAERAFGGRDFTISGGGFPTQCPYPDPNLDLEQTLVIAAGPIGWVIDAFANTSNPCKGAGNDPGTIEPVVLLPRRERDPKSQTPVTTASVIHSTGVASNACIGHNIACAPTFTLGSDQVSNDPSCSRNQVANAYGDKITARRFDQTCVNASYTHDCFLVYTRTIAPKPKQPPMSYVVTHTCDPNDPADAANELSNLVTYLTTGPGAPSRPPATVHCTGPGKGSGGGGGRCGYTLTITLPTPSGAVSPGETVHISVTRTTYQITNPEATPNIAATGDVALTTTNGIPRLRLNDPSSGETLYETPTGAPTFTSSDDERPFNWTATIDSSGNLTATLTGADHPDFAHTFTVSVTDQTRVNQDCTTTLPNGLKACRDLTHTFCGNPPVPCTKTLPAADKPMVIGQHSYLLGAVPLPDTISSTNALDANDTYVVSACLGWYRLLTAADYRPDPTGSPAWDDAHLSCQTRTLRATCATRIACQFRRGNIILSNPIHAKPGNG